MAELTEFDSLSVLDDVCNAYTEDLLIYYKTQRALCIRKGTSERSMPRYTFGALSRKIFDQFDKAVIPDLYCALFDCSESYCQMKQITSIGIENEMQSQIGISDLVLNLMVPYQLPHTVRSTDPNIANPSRPKSCLIPPRVRFTVEQSKEILARCLPIAVPPESKIWKQIRYILVPDNNSKKIAQFAPIIGEAAANGTISYGALVYCMHTDLLNENLTPQCILQALYLGPLRAATVEFFASGRSAEFRKQCREFIFLAEIAKKDPLAFKKYCPTNIIHHPALCNYRSFLTNTTELLNELRGVKKTVPLIPNGWACAAIKKFGKRTYVEKTWRPETLFDLIWTVLVQRPALKKFVCETLEKEFHDYGAARFWKKIMPAQLDRYCIRNPFDQNIDPLFVSDEYLNFPPIVQNVKCVVHQSQLGYVIANIRAEIESCGKAIVGLDAEWTAFTGESKANILQVAIRNNIYIIDLDNLQYEQELKTFFIDLFLDPRIVKLGFQFNEDLAQLRNAVPHCKALYQPENVLCVGKMIRTLLDITESNENCAEIMNEIVPYFSLTPLDDTIESIPDESNKVSTGGDKEDMETVEPKQSNANDSSNTESASDRILNRGLSYICEKILGRPLDKTEQCSVWDRRPLRSLQIRYAAMDAYCCIMLYDVCVKWALRLGTTIEDVVVDQKPIRVSLPLFSDAD